MKYLYINEDGDVSQREKDSEENLQVDLQSIDEGLLMILRFNIGLGRFEQLEVSAMEVEGEDDDPEIEQETEVEYSISGWESV